MTSTKPPRVTMRPPLRLQIVVWAALAAAHAAMAVALLHAHAPSLAQWAMAGLLAGMVGIAHLYPVQFAPRLRVSADTAPAFVAVLLLPPPLAIATSALGIGAGEALRRRAPVQFAFNVAVAALRSATGVAVFLRLSPDGLSLRSPALTATVAAAAAAGAMYAINAALVDIVIAVQQRISPLRGWWARHHGQLPLEVSLYILGLLVGAVGARWPAALVLLSVPSVVVYRALRAAVGERMQMRRSLERLADTIDERSPYTEGHSRRVADLARAVALELRMAPEAAESVYLAARVHNAGAIGVRRTTLVKAQPLTDGEWSELRTHPAAGARLLVVFPDYAEAGDVVLAHHERWDGRGYPRALRGEQIPIGARIIAVADAFVAMMSHRPYRRALTPELVRAELRGGRGAQFDPAAVDALFAVLSHHPEFVPRPGPVPSPREGRQST